MNKTQSAIFQKEYDAIVNALFHMTGKSDSIIAGALTRFGYVWNERYWIKQVKNLKIKASINKRLFDRYLVLSVYAKSDTPIYKRDLWIKEHLVFDGIEE